MQHRVPGVAVEQDGIRWVPISIRIRPDTNLKGQSVLGLVVDVVELRVVHGRQALDLTSFSSRGLENLKNATFVHDGRVVTCSHHSAAALVTIDVALSQKW